MRNLVVLFLISIVIISCDENDPGTGSINDVPNVASDPNLNAVSNTEVIGEVHLLITTARSTGENTYFEPGTIIWNFDEAMLTINNTNSDPSKEDSFDSGTYNYSLAPSNQSGVNNLVVDGVNLGLFYYENGHDSLTVFPESADGIILNFLKIP